jgi:hypothetical protein
MSGTKGNAAQANGAQSKISHAAPNKCPGGSLGKKFMGKSGERR